MKHDAPTSCISCRTSSEPSKVYDPNTNLVMWHCIVCGHETVCSAGPPLLAGMPAHFRFIQAGILRDRGLL